MGSLCRLLIHLIMVVGCGIIYIEREGYNMEQSKLIQLLEEELEQLTHEMTTAMHAAWRASSMREEVEHMDIYEQLEQRRDLILETIKALYE